MDGAPKYSMCKVVQMSEDKSICSYQISTCKDNLLVSKEDLFLIVIGLQKEKMQGKLPERHTRTVVWKLQKPDEGK